MARGLSAVVDGGALTAVVNVGDDEDVYGVRVCADLDTVVYTLAGIHGPHGWGVSGDTIGVMDHLSDLGVDTTFALGDRDLATCLARTMWLRDGHPLSQITGRLATRLGVAATVLPVTDDLLRTRVRTTVGEWLAFQEYFVIRGHRDEIDRVEFVGAEAALPAPGVIEAITAADVVVIAPSNPVLSVWPILAVPRIRRAVASHDNVVAVSPLFAGKALKGPAHRVLASHGLPAGNAGVLAAYEGLIDHFVVDIDDHGDIDRLATPGVRIHALDTRIGDAPSGARFAAELLDLVTPSPIGGHR